MRHFVVAGLLLLGVVPFAAAQPTFMNRSTQYATAARNTWEQVIKPKFLAAMSPKDQATLRAIDFRFPVGAGAFDAFATREQGQMVVVISSGFVAYQDAAIDALVTARQFGLVNAFVPYLEFADQRAAANVALIRNGSPPELVPSFATYARLDPASYAAFAQSTEYNNLMFGYRINSLAYVLGHEIGHHVSGRYGTASDSEQTEREFQADLYSVKILVKAGLSPLAAGPLMAFFQESGPDSRHPPAICRLITFTMVGIPVMMTDPGFLRYLQDHPADRAAIDETRASIAANEEAIRATCGQHVMLK